MPSVQNGLKHNIIHKDFPLSALLVLDVILSTEVEYCVHKSEVDIKGIQSLSVYAFPIRHGS